MGYSCFVYAQLDFTKYPLSPFRTLKKCLGILEKGSGTFCVKMGVFLMILG